MRQSKLFKLPIVLNKSGSKYFNHLLHDSSCADEPVASFSNTEMAASAMRAINHIDAISDALQNIINDYERYIAIYPPDLTDDDNARIANLMQIAKIALSNYQEETA